MALIFNCSIESAASALSLKKYGSEYHGPCPICGGSDRFWIKQASDGIAVHCRQGCTFKDLAFDLRQRGIASKDHSGPNRRFTSQTDLIRADLLIAMYQAGQRPSGADRVKLARLADELDSCRKNKIIQILRETA